MEVRGRICGGLLLARLSAGHCVGGQKPSGAKSKEGRKVRGARKRGLGAEERRHLRRLLERTELELEVLRKELWTDDGRRKEGGR